MNCSCCDKQKNQLTVKSSGLLPSTKLHLCNECIAGKREPRYLIILVGRTEGHLRVRDYIKHHRYVGDDILAKEIV